MAPAYFEESVLLPNQSVQAFTDKLLNEVYPTLFEHLNTITGQLGFLVNEPYVFLLRSQLHKVYQELDELYRKEKWVLFPFIKKLEEEHKLSETCKPFKNVKSHYVNLLAQLMHFRETMAKCDNRDDLATEISEILASVNIFERLIIKTQITKDKHLFAQFKSCTGCKTL